MPKQPTPKPADAADAIEATAPEAEPESESTPSESTPPPAAQTAEPPQDESPQPTAPAEEPEIPLAEQIKNLQAQLDAATEAQLRAQAEAQNTRRRAEAEAEKSRRFAIAHLVEDLLPVVDNLDRALANMDAEAPPAITEGLELTRKSFLNSLQKHGVTQIEPVGQPFDPEQHQAVAMLPNADLEPNSILEVHQKGYSLNGRLLRPAMVVVSKAPD